MEKLTNCPVCNGTSSQLFLRVKDHSTSKETFDIVSCESCSFKYTNPRPDAQEILRYYESEDYISHTDKKEGLFNKVYQSVRDYAIKQKYKLINGFNTSKSLLDYGCGTGDFLHYVQTKGWKTLGAEPNPNARKVMQEKGISSILPEEINKQQPGSFGVITLWHVLEHIHDVNEKLKAFHQLLEENGKLIIAVPNHTSYDAGYYKEYWAAYDMPIHLYHFSPSTIELLLTNADFNLEKVLPMKFDSYYVSLLSEKYKNGGGVINATLRGFISNLKAGLSKNPTYSSQIYIFSKN